MRGYLHVLQKMSSADCLERQVWEESIQGVGTYVGHDEFSKRKIGACAGLNTCKQKNKEQKFSVFLQLYLL